MDTREMIDMLVKSSESNRGKYVPWWEDDFENCMYRYDILSKNEINEVTECVAASTAEAMTAQEGIFGLTPLHLLVWQGFYDAAAKVLDGGADPNVKAGEGKGIMQDTCTGATPLMLACCRGNLSMARLLLDKGADASVCDAAGRNAYHYLALGRIKNMPVSYECQKRGVLQREDIARLLPDDIINVRDGSEMTPLELMINGENKNNTYALTGVFLEKGADISKTAEDGSSLLLMAVKNGHMAASLKLMEHKELVNKPDNSGNAPLHIAAQRGDAGLSMALLEHGADKNLQNNEGKTPKDIAEEGYREELKQLLKTGRLKLSELSRLTSNAFARFSDDEMDYMAIALYLAGKLVREADTDDDEEMYDVLRVLYSALIKDEKCGVLDILRKAGIDFTMPIHRGGSVECIRDNCLGGNYGIKVIKKFIDMGIDMDEAVIKGKTPANIVASVKDRTMIYGGKDDYCEKAAQFFSAESMVQTDESGTTAMHEAARNNHVDMLRVMIEKGADVNVVQDEPADAGNTPLHVAAIYGCGDVVRLLMESGADDTLQNVNGETAAHLAVMKKKFGGDLKADERIAVLEALNNVDIARNDGSTPLMLLQYLDLNTIMDVMPVLLDKGVDVNHTDDKGNTALIISTYNQSYKGIVKELVRAGADVNAANNDGNTALHFALRYGDQETSRFLIKKGADYNRANNAGVTPVQTAVEKGYDTVLELMTDIE